MLKPVPKNYPHKLKTINCFHLIFAIKFLYMNLHEYQAKELLKKYNVPVQEGIAVDNVMSAEEAYRQIKNQTGNNFAVVKAQIHAGGRGKGGGVKLAKSADEARELAKQILGMNLITHQTGPEGRLVQKAGLGTVCMGRGAVIELDAKQDDPVTVLANDKPVAKGEIIIHGDKIGVSITDILKGYT